MGAPFWEAVEVYFASFCGNKVNIFKVDICLQRVAPIGNKIGTIYSIRQFPLFLQVQKGVGDFKTFFDFTFGIEGSKGVIGCVI